MRILDDKHETLRIEYESYLLCKDLVFQDESSIDQEIENTFMKNDVTFCSQVLKRPDNSRHY